MAERSPPRARIYAGEQLRALRHAGGVNQRMMAEKLGISVSYLSQLESGERPLTTSVLAALGRHHPATLAMIEGEGPARRLAALSAALADPSLAGALPPETIAKLAEERPEVADRIVAMHRAMRAAEERLQIAEETMVAGSSARLPWEDVRDWFHEAGNYVDDLDRAAEALAAQIGSPLPDEAALVEALHERGLTLARDADEDAPLARVDAEHGLLVLKSTLTAESRRFLIAHRLGAIAFADTIDTLVRAAPLGSEEARRLLQVGLANYAAGALTMPYTAFRDAARVVRHDIDRLSRRFGVSFEQACHRLSTLQRTGAAGIPFYFCRVDMAGNITKRHSATRLQFARFGGACPLWIVHEAVAIPDRIQVQQSQTPDGVRYVSMAKGLVKPSGRFTRNPRRYAVLLGCEMENAGDFVYADVIDKAAVPTMIGISCRLCPRDDCDQRAFPPADRHITVDTDRRDVVPYRVV